MNGGAKISLIVPVNVTCRNRLALRQLQGRDVIPALEDDLRHTNFVFDDETFSDVIAYRYIFTSRGADIKDVMIEHNADAHTVCANTHTLHML